MGRHGHTNYITPLCWLFILCLCAAIRGCNWWPCQAISGHWQCLHVCQCPMSLAMASLLSCLHLAIYTLQQTQLHQKTIFREKKTGGPKKLWSLAVKDIKQGSYFWDILYFFLHIPCKPAISLSFVFKLKFWILFTQRVRGCQFIPVSTNNLASNVDLISNSRSAVSRSWFLFSEAREQRRH